METTLCRSGNRLDVRNVGVEFRLRPCISFAIVLYHCSAPASALFDQTVERKRRQKDVLWSTSDDWDSIPPRNTAEAALSGAMLLSVSDGYEATIDPYNSNKGTGHPRPDDEALGEKAKKEKRTKSSLIKHLLDVNQQKRSEALRRSDSEAMRRRKKKKNLIIIFQLFSNNFFFLSPASWVYADSYASMAFWVKKCNTLLAVRQPMGQKKDLVIFFRAKKKNLEKRISSWKKNFFEKKNIRTVIWTQDFSRVRRASWPG